MNEVRFILDDANLARQIEEAAKPMRMRMTQESGNVQTWLIDGKARERCHAPEYGSAFFGCGDDEQQEHGLPAGDAGMSVLLRPDTIEVLSRRGTGRSRQAMDPELTSTGTVQGTIQEKRPRDNFMAQGSGQGPAEPNHQRTAKAFLDDPVQPGDVLRVRDTDWRAQTVRFVETPRAAARWIAGQSSWELRHG